MLELNLVSNILSANFSDKLIMPSIEIQDGFNPLSSPDVLFSNKKTVNQFTSISQGLPMGMISFSNQTIPNALISNNNVSFADQKLQILQQKSIQFADKEWQSGVKETGGKNRPP